MYQHYKALANSTPLPIIVYSVQGRTSVNVEPATIVRLAEIKNIVGVKEASGSITQMASIIARVPESFMVLSGDDAIALPLIALGGHGVISVVSNEIPASSPLSSKPLCKGDFVRARQLQKKYQALMEINFIETSPGPVKFAMSRMGFCEPVLASPYGRARSRQPTKVEAVLESLGLLSGVRA